MKIHATANTIALFSTQEDPDKKRSIVRKALREAHKAAKEDDRGFAPYYQALKTPARDYFAGGLKDPAGLLALIARMERQQKQATKENRLWHERDARGTAAVAKTLLALQPRFQDLDVSFVLPGPGTKAILEFPDIDVSVTPDVYVQKIKNGAPLIGAMRLYTARGKAYQLGEKAAQLVAVMQYQWLVRVSTGKRMPISELCMVLECFQERITHAPVDPSLHLKRIEAATREFARMWTLLDNQDAA